MYLFLNLLLSYGIAAGIEEPPENCEAVTGTCDVLFVQKDDPTEPCDENVLIKPMRRQRKKKIHVRRNSSTIILFKTM